MSIETTINSNVPTYGGLAALISTRFYHHRMPQDPTLPAVVYQRVGGGVFQVRGRIVASAPRFQFDVWAETASEAITVRDQLIASLLNQYGTLGDVEIVEEADHEDLRSRLCRRRIDVRITHAGT